MIRQLILSTVFVVVIGIQHLLASDSNYVYIPENSEIAELSRPVKIMPLGNSITASQDGYASYRYWLWKQLDTTGFRGKIDFVGTLHGVLDSTEAKYPDFDSDHEGHGGFNTNEILSEIENYATYSVPDVVLMHLGTNDAIKSIHPDTTAANLSRIIDILRNYNPRVVIVIAKVLPCAYFSANIVTVNRVISSFAIAKSQKNSPVILVDQNAGYNIWTDLNDGTHLSESGEIKFASRFCIALKLILNRMVGKPLEISPPSGNYSAIQNFDIAVFMRQKSTVSSYVALLDNVQVPLYSSWVTLPDSTGYFRVKNLRFQDVGGAGVHKFKITARLANGCVVSDSTVWNVK